MFDPSTHEPRSGKSALMNELMAEFAGKPDALADTIIGNCTTAKRWALAKWHPNQYRQKPAE
jgi:hypothetical protein